MIYGHHRAKGAPALGALPGEEGPFGRRPAPVEDDGTDAGVQGPTTMVPSPRDGSGW
ncbi:hypothetical protein OHA79_44080 [Streptomyces sp. NBC_00841]|uniref:hypothetical protein n=1 Tax=unclassified Streptomyces TaxID=2593676 RepID=UPI00225573F3|nr:MULTISPECIES: hypothetical protein [unclassified Streptomyces]MCX4530064.1 hypothetical protein [Streptomyces sp. NBC_01669]WSA04144.1 hypothetical protein OHA79_44080 [Streptomyces sp. NBC_00841]